MVTSSKSSNLGVATKEDPGLVTYLRPSRNRRPSRSRGRYFVAGAARGGFVARLGGLKKIKDDGHNFCRPNFSSRRRRIEARSEPTCSRRPNRRRLRAACVYVPYLVSRAPRPGGRCAQRRAAHGDEWTCTEQSGSLKQHFYILFRDIFKARPLERAAKIMQKILNTRI